MTLLNSRHFKKGAILNTEQGTPAALEWVVRWFSRLHLGVTVSGVFILVS
jgi:hypothetical protein